MCFDPQCHIIECLDLKLRLDDLERSYHFTINGPVVCDLIVILGENADMVAIESKPRQRDNLLRIGLIPYVVPRVSRCSPIESVGIVIRWLLPI